VCRGKKFVRACGVMPERKSNGGSTAVIGSVSAAVTCRCSLARTRRDRQVLQAYGLPITPGENPGSGHFYLAKNRTFLLCVDMTADEQHERSMPMPKKSQDEADYRTKHKQYENRLGGDFRGVVLHDPQVYSLFMCKMKACLPRRAGKSRFQPKAVSCG
jgi:hypothetical protein